MIECKICKESFSSRSIGTHVRFVHGMKSRDYYDTYIKTESEGLCPVCGNPCRFQSITTGYAQTCSSTCAQLNPKTREKIESTNMEKYGVKAPAQNHNVRKKTMETNIKRYGVDTPYKNNDIKQKGINTVQHKYGVNNVFALDSVKEKSKDTMQEKYGVELNILRPEIKDHIKNSRRNSYYLEFITRLNRKNIEYLDGKDQFLDMSYNRHYKCTLCDKLFTSNDTDAYSIQCGCLRRRSKAEHEIKEWLTSCGYDPKQSETISDKDGRLELDIVIESDGIKLAIEFCGLYWHSELFRPKNYHKRKLIAATSHGYKLIQVFEDEWNNKKDIVKSIILQTIHHQCNIIYARKCNVIKFTKTPTVFLEENHIQGTTKSSHSYGLIYDGIVVSVCTFSKSRFSDGWECVRFCNKLNTKVIGSFSRLLKHFIEEITPNIITSYSDLRYFTGDIYLSNGFTKENESPIGYYYCPKGFQEKINRMKFQKHKLRRWSTYDKNKTEVQIMTESGYTRIFDAGQAVFKLHIQIG
jgi:hypothetical protein